MSHENSLATRVAVAYASMIVRHPVKVLVTLLVLTVGATFAASRLTINSNQLDLISQDLQEVKDVKRVIDMVGGTGHLLLALRSNDEEALKVVADELAERISADKEHVRNLTYKTPVQFIQENMVLFVKNEDLVEGKNRIMKFVRDRARRANPFFIELKKTEPYQLDLSDLVAKYSSIGKKTILDDYYISPDRKMLLLIMKPMWDSNQLDKTGDLIDRLNKLIGDYSSNNTHGVKLFEGYDQTPPDKGTISYGFTGSYKTNVDDSYAIKESLDPVTILAFVSIFFITILFFRKIWPTVIVMTGVAIGTILTMGFTYVTVGQLNMITSILAGILMGFGVDYGIHFTFRTRIELGAGKPYDVAIKDALVNAGRPAFVAAVVTGGSFLVLMVSQFRGFSQFGFLSACGTVIIAFTMFSFCPAVLSLVGRRWPALPEKLIGHMDPPKGDSIAGELRIPNPTRVLAIGAVVVTLLCLLAIPFNDDVLPKDAGFFQRLSHGVRFDYNTRALMPRHQYSVELQDEIGWRFQISSDPTGVYTKDLAEAKEVWDEMTVKHPEKYKTVEMVVSPYSFVPPLENAQKNAAVLAEWKEELKDLDMGVLPEEQQKKMPLFQKILDAKPFAVDEVPEVYRKQFESLPTAQPENQGYLTWLYPRVDLWDGKQMLAFADETGVIKTDSGKEYRSAGQPTLFAKLARIVLWDGKLTVLLVGIWILLMHYLDFRSVSLAAASVIPLGVGLVMMLGIMSLIDERLNFMNIIMLPIMLGFGVSHGLYLLHRFLEGTSPIVALRSVGSAVASSTLTAIAGFGSLFIASHHGLKSMGFVACLGLTTTLIVSFTVLGAVLQLMHDKRKGKAGAKPGAVEAA